MRRINVRRVEAEIVAEAPSGPPVMGWSVMCGELSCPRTALYRSKPARCADHSPRPIVKATAAVGESCPARAGSPELASWLERTRGSEPQ